MLKSRARICTAAGSLALLVWMLRRIGLHQVTQDVSRLGWGLALVIILGGAPYLVRTCAWLFTFPEGRRSMSFARLLGLRLGSEALAQFGFLGTALGDGVRVSLLSNDVETTSGVVSVALDRALFILSASMVTAAGAFAALLSLRLPHRVAVISELFAFGIVLMILAAAVVVHKRIRFVSAVAGVASRVPLLRNWTEQKWEAIQSIEQELLDFFNRRPQSFRAALLLNLASHLAAVGEVWLVLHLLDVRLSVAGSFAVEGLTKAVNAIGGFNPGNVGTYEGGNMLIGKLLGFGASTGIALAFARRVRSVFWSVVGAGCLVVLNRKRGPQPAGESDAAGDRALAAIILAEMPYMDGVGRLPRVGEVPVLLRTILALRKTGFARIAIATGPALRASIAEQLRRTGRLPNSVEWVETGASEHPLPDHIEDLAKSGITRVAFVSGDRTYHATLLETLAGWSSPDRGLALKTFGNELGACILPVLSAKTFVREVLPDIGLMSQLDSWTSCDRSVAAMKPPENLWQRIRTEQNRLAAENKLDGWLVKSTDGIFARFNRKISIPISRQLIRFPITPNMVSLFTLGVSLASGVLFASGGYLNMLAGALLGLFASILDGCDGEVARLKMQESAFGCWLETVCDYLYYLFMFTGMTIGLLRSTGDRLYLLLGCALAFGALMSFLMTAMQRRRLTAAGRPEQLLKNWQQEADRRKSNPLVYLARHTEFIVRRCFLPYAILFFALFRIVPVAFVLSVVGANVVWPMALYSYWTFPAASNRRVTA